MTAPSAISASYFSVLASLCRASGASSEPGTETTVSAVTPSSASRLRQASSIATPILSLKRERTIPTRRPSPLRSEEHTSELQSHVNLVCRLLLEKKKKNNKLHLLYKKKEIYITYNLKRSFN